MQFSPAFQQELESVDIIESNRFGGVDVLATVRMVILPLERTPQEVTIPRESYTPRFGAVLETPNAELKRNRQIRRADGTVYTIVDTLDGLGEQQLILEAEGTP